MKGCTCDLRVQHSSKLLDLLNLALRYDVCLVKQDDIGELDLIR